LTRRTVHRNWRRRGRRAQVAAVATLLGLLLVVTFIANYLSTQLPNQMLQNDLNHEITVENQLGRFDALLQAVSAAHAVGAQVTQPLSLGSAGVPPFAAPDTSYLIAPASGTWAQVNYTTAGANGNTVVTTPIPLGAGVVAALRNSYAPGAEVALVQGAVVYADLGGTPIFVNSPAITATSSSGVVTALSIWVPQFVGTIPATAGAMTVNLVARLISTDAVTVSSGTHLSVAPGTSVVFTLTSQYAAAWNNTFSSYHWPGVTVTCTGVAGTSTARACSSAYAATAAMGKVVITVPGTNLADLSVTVALFSLQAQ
jgi:hypothetical protein